MEKYLKPDEASRIDKCLSLVRKAIIITKSAPLFEVLADVHDNEIDFRFYYKGKPTYEFIETISFRTEFDFEEKYMLLNHKLNHLVNKGYLPI